MCFVRETTIRSWEFKSPRYGWCSAQVQEDRGLIAITSHCGSWSHTWNPDPKCTGRETFMEFAVGLLSGSHHYLMSKFGYNAPDLGSVFDGYATQAHCKKHVLSERRDGTYSKDRARNLWNALDWIDFDSGDLFCSSICACDYWHKVFEEPWYEIQERESDNHQWLRLVLEEVIGPYFKSATVEASKCAGL